MEKIISQCHARPAGQNAKQWMKENGICEKTYYLWQRRIRQGTYEQINASTEIILISSVKEEISVAEIPLRIADSSSVIHPEYYVITPVAVIETLVCQIAV